MDRVAMIEQTAAYVQATLTGEGSGHDWWHIYRVWTLAQRIGRAEQVDLFVVEAAALLHDIADWKAHDGDSSVGPRQARAWLRQFALPAAQVDHVCFIIEHLSFKGAQVEQTPLSLEGQIVQDADRLDALGAIGIARTFAYGGSKNRMLYDPAQPPQEYATAEAYVHSASPSINHFYEKLLLLKDRMNTAEARRIAESRHAFLELYLQQFFAEWDGAA